MESWYLFVDEQLVVVVFGYCGGNLLIILQVIVVSDIIFFMEFWNVWCSQVGLEKLIVFVGLCLNDFNLVLEVVCLGVGVVLEWCFLVVGVIVCGELVQFIVVIVFYFWYYWLIVFLQVENWLEVVWFIVWLEEEIVFWCQQISVQFLVDGGRFVWVVCFWERCQKLCLVGY